MDSSVSLDDLTGLFGAPPPGMSSPSQIVQGIITAFSTIDGSNTILVNNAALTNVPMLLSGAEVNYAKGDPVLLLVLGNTYMLLGKVAGVATPQYASASSAYSGYFASTASQSYTSPASVTLAVANIVVPVWANRMTFFGVAEVSFKNGSGQPDSDCVVQHIMAGYQSGSFLNWASANSHNQKFEKSQTGVQWAVTPGSTIQASAFWSCTTSGTINASQVSGTCIFSKS